MTTLLLGALFCVMCVWFIRHSEGIHRAVMLAASLAVLASFMLRLAVLSFDANAFQFGHLLSVSPDAANRAVVFLILGTAAFWAGGKLAVLLRPDRRNVPPLRLQPIAGALIATGLFISGLLFVVNLTIGVGWIGTPCAFLMRFLPDDLIVFAVMFLAVAHWPRLSRWQRVGAGTLFLLSTAAGMIVGSRGAIFTLTFAWLMAALLQSEDRAPAFRKTLLVVGVGLMLVPPLLGFVTEVRERVRAVPESARLACPSVAGIVRRAGGRGGVTSPTPVPPAATPPAGPPTPVPPAATLPAGPPTPVPPAATPPAVTPPAGTPPTVTTIPPEDLATALKLRPAKAFRILSDRLSGFDALVAVINSPPPPLIERYLRPWFIVRAALADFIIDEIWNVSVPASGVLFAVGYQGYSNFNIRHSGAWTGFGFFYAYFGWFGGLLGLAALGFLTTWLLARLMAARMWWQTWAPFFLYSYAFVGLVSGDLDVITSGFILQGLITTMWLYVFVSIQRRVKAYTAHASSGQH